MKYISIVLCLILLIGGTSCNGDKGPTPEQLQSGITKVMGNWAVEVASETTTDSCDSAAAYVAYRWAVTEHLDKIKKFVLKEITAEMVKQAVNALFPASSMLTEVLRGQIIKWLYKTATDYSLEKPDLRSGSITLTINEVNKLIQQRGILPAIAAPIRDLPGDSEITNYFIVNYDQAKRQVSILIISKCNGKDPRAWEAIYTVDDDGSPTDSRQSLRYIDLTRLPDVEPKTSPAPAPSPQPSPFPPPPKPSAPLPSPPQTTPSPTPFTAPIKVETAGELIQFFYAAANSGKANEAKSCLSAKLAEQFEQPTTGDINTVLEALTGSGNLLEVIIEEEQTASISVTQAEEYFGADLADILKNDGKIWVVGYTLKFNPPFPEVKRSDVVIQQDGTFKVWHGMYLPEEPRRDSDYLIVNPPDSIPAFLVYDFPCRAWRYEVHETIQKPSTKQGYDNYNVAISIENTSSALYFLAPRASLGEARQKLVATWKEYSYSSPISMPNCTYLPPGWMTIIEANLDVPSAATDAQLWVITPDLRKISISPGGPFKPTPSASKESSNLEPLVIEDRWEITPLGTISLGTGLAFIVKFKNLYGYDQTPDSIIFQVNADLRMHNIQCREEQTLAPLTEKTLLVSGFPTGGLPKVAESLDLFIAVWDGTLDNVIAYNTYSFPPLPTLHPEMKISEVKGAGANISGEEMVTIWFKISNDGESPSYLDRIEVEFKPFKEDIEVSLLIYPGTEFQRNITFRGPGWDLSEQVKIILKDQFGNVLGSYSGPLN